MPKLPDIQTDLLSGLSDEDLMSELPPPESLSASAVGQSGPHQFALPRSNKKRNLDKLLKSPWLWVGLAAGVLLLVVVIVLVVVFSSSPTETPIAHPVAEGTAPAPVPNTVALPAPPKPPATTPAPKAKETKPPTTTPTPKAEETKPPATPPTPKAEETKPPATTPTTPTTESPPSQPTTTPPETLVDKDALLAGLKTFSLHLTNLPTEGPVNALIVSRLKEAAIRFNLKLVAKDPNVMEIELKGTEKEPAKMEICAEMKCATESGNVVTAWTGSEKLMPAVQAKPPKVPVQPNMKNMRAAVGKLFQQFSLEVKKARAKKVETP
jgi:hypothetical protein